jgi:1-acyl-sn-glycerol-3-phosphate acyltransferase
MVRLPTWLRAPVTVFTFAMFFSSGLVLGFVVLPLFFLLSLGSRQRFRNVSTRFLAWLYPWFCYWMKFIGLLDYERIGLPPELPRDRPYVLIANHPSLIDVLFCLGWFEGLTCVVKAAWFRSVLLGPIVRATHYIAGPGLPGDEDDDDGEDPASLRRMVQQLADGHPFVVFPEGTRSPPDRLLRFVRGPFEAAVRARVPVLPLFIGVDQPGLTKGIPLAPNRMTFSFEWLPIVDCGATDIDGRSLRNHYYRLYRERHERFLRERASRPGAEVADSAPALPSDARAQEE